jgi:hypothetical protein
MKSARWMLLCLALVWMVMSLPVGAEEAATAPAGAAQTRPVGASGAAGDEGAPAEVKVAVYVISMGKYDVGTGSFTADFYLDFQHAPGVDASGFEFVNGRASSSDVIINTPTEQCYRIQASLVSAVDLKRFPFDRQRIKIILEDKSQTIKTLRYAPLLAESDLDPAVTFIGWNIDRWTARVGEHTYRNWNERYSQYEYQVDISRIAINSFMKTFLPVFFIVLIVLSGFAMGPEQAATRLGMAGSGLVAAVMFHVSIAAQIPPVGYLTFADKFMVLTYLVTLVSFLINVVIIAAQRRGRDAVVQKIHRATEATMFVLVPAAYVLLFWLMR